MNRREFLQKVSKLAAGACCAAAFGPLGSRYAFGQSTGGNGRTAVFLNQFGGCDPLNSFSIPFNLGEYYDARPTLGLQGGDFLTMNGSNYGLHPSLSNLQRLFNSGEVALIRKIGDPRGTRSHFTSQDIMSRGTTELAPSDTRGWIGRLGDLYFEDLSLNTMSIGAGSPLSIQSNRTDNTPLAIGSIEGVGYSRPAAHGLDYNRNYETLRNKLVEMAGSDRGLASVHDSARQVFNNAIDVLGDARSDYSTTVPFETSYGVSNFLRQVATLNTQSVGTKVFYGGIGGWDNHANQGGVTGTQAGLLANIDRGIGHFETEMKAKGGWNDIVLCIFTEFGRTTNENGGAGTDHGWGFTMALVGGGINGGEYGVDVLPADFTQRRWLDPEVDFRNPFSEIINWLGFDPLPVFPQDYDRQALGLFA